jgi:hypothetical protein
MGLEGLVSKRSDRPYRGGKSPHWIKVKNRQHHAMTRVMESIRWTTLARLLEQKQQLIERLQGDPGPEERDEIERLLEKIDTALNLLDEAGPGIRDWSAALWKSRITSIHRFPSRTGVPPSSVDSYGGAHVWPGERSDSRTFDSRERGGCW